MGPPKPGKTLATKRVSVPTAPKNQETEQVDEKRPPPPPSSYREEKAALALRGAKVAADNNKRKFRKLLHAERYPVREQTDEAERERKESLHPEGERLGQGKGDPGWEVKSVNDSDDDKQSSNANVPESSVQNGGSIFGWLGHGKGPSEEPHK